MAKQRKKTAAQEETSTDQPATLEQAVEEVKTKMGGEVIEGPTGPAEGAPEQQRPVALPDPRRIAKS